MQYKVVNRRQRKLFVNLLILTIIAFQTHALTNKTVEEIPDNTTPSTLLTTTHRAPMVETLEEMIEELTLNETVLLAEQPLVPTFNGTVAEAIDALIDHEHGILEPYENSSALVPASHSENSEAGWWIFCSSQELYVFAALVAVIIFLIGKELCY